MTKPANGTEIQPFITTKGRSTGNPHPVQIRVYYWDGRMIGTSPFPKTKREWVSNLLAHPKVTIQTETKVVHATATLLEEGMDDQVKENISKFRIGWRSATCPVFEPEIDAFIEFFPEAPVEELFDQASVIHSPTQDPLSVTTLPELKEWQAQGKCYPKQIPVEMREPPVSPVPPKA